MKITIYLFTLITSLQAFGSSPLLPNIKLTCSGYVYQDGNKYDLNDGFVSITNNVATVKGFGIPDGTYKVIPERIREDSFSIQNISNPKLGSVINRLSGNMSFYESGNSSDVRDGKFHFIGKCLKSNPLF